MNTMKKILSLALVMNQVMGQASPNAAQNENLFCENDANCAVETINYDLTQIFNFTELAGGGRRAEGYNVLPPLTHFDIISNSGPVQCSGSVAHVYDSASAMHRQVPMVNLNPRVCRANWDNLFYNPSEIAAYGGNLVVFFELDNMVPNGQSVEFQLEMDETTPILTTQVQANYFPVDYNIGEGATPEDLLLSLQLTPNVLANCAANPAAVSFKIGTCDPFTANGVADATKPGHNNYELSVSRTIINQCKSSTQSDAQAQNGNLTQYVEVLTTLVADASCESELNLPERAELLRFSVISTIGEITVSGSTGIKKGLWLAVESYTPIPCDGRMLSMARLQIVVKSQYTGDGRTIAEEIYVPGNMDGDMQMIRDEAAHVCTTSDGLIVCNDTYTSSECMLLDRDALNGQCTFNYLGFVDIQKRYNFNDGTTTGNKALIIPYLTKDTFNGDLCPAPVATNDVTTSFNAELTLEGNSMDSLIIGTVTLLGLPATSAVTLVIQSVTISMEGYTRQYEVTDKSSLMTIPSSSYYNDVNYCRFENTPGVCTPFYSSNTNPLTVATPADYAVPFKGHSSCQNMAVRNLDKWSFTPSRWVFERFLGKESQMFVTVVARISDCTTQGARRLRELSDSSAVIGRELQNSAAAPVDILNVTTVKIFYIAAAPPAGDSTTDVVGSSVVIIIIAILVGVSFICCVGSGIVWKRSRDRAARSRQDSDASSFKVETHPSPSPEAAALAMH